ncbi:MAG TPA: cytochrome-c peroxidase, partial [Bacteroidia bacterium]|nr:cytochrome-c peroxidase [Bacteroidia bacterium]
MKIGLAVAMMCALLIAAVATRPMARESGPRDLYMERLEAFSAAQQALAITASTADLSAGEGRAAVTADIAACRRKLKSLDFWFRYLEPIAYKRLNGPLPVEWETEVFEKWEPPYRREGAGLTLAELHLGEDDPQRDVLQSLMAGSALAVSTFAADSITRHLDSFSPFFLCNRLYLLNLATIYTTGFECPAPERVIPELLAMLADVAAIYQAHNQAFPDHALSPAYLILYARMVIYVQQQPQDIARFDHYTFVKDYVNPLFGLNQGMIVDHGVASESYQDYTLSDTVGTIFDKGLFFAQDPKGIYRRIQDEGLLSEIAAVGKLLFYDPILSGNQQRSCASCHRQETYFTDTRVQTALQLDRQTRLPRNTPSLLNVVSHHLLMLDGKHLDLQSQATAVIANPIELGGEKATVLKEILSCPTYQKAFQKF